MTARGHGELGLVDSVRTFADLADEAEADRRPYVDYFPGMIMTAGQWAVFSGRTYVQRAHFVFGDGMLRDVVGVETDAGNLVRVESVADCQATAGTFYTNIDTALLTTPFWDSGAVFDLGAVYDTTLPLDLYVHLPGDVDPNGVAVVALLGFYFASAAEVHPVLGPDKLVNGAVEGSLAGWTESVSGAGNTTAYDTALFTGRGSSGSMQLKSAGTATGNATRLQDVATVIGAVYRLSGYYQADPAFLTGPGTVTPRMLIGDVAGSLTFYEDGRNADGAGTVDLNPALGEWRRFFFDFVAVSNPTRVQLRLRIGGAASPAQLNFDGLKLQRVYRYVYYEPRLSADAFEEVEIGSRSIYFGVKPVGISSFSVLDADGGLEGALGQLVTSNKVARVAVGGSFGDHTELGRDHWRDMYYGLSRGELWLTDDRIDFELEDPLAQVLDTELPIKRYTLAEFPNLDLNREGYAQPIVLGNFLQLGIATRDAVILTRIDLTAAGYGIYHLADTSKAPGGLSATTPIVYQYVTGQRKDDDLAHPLRLLTSGTHYSWDRTTGRLTVLRDLRTFKFDNAGNAFGYYNLDFNIGAGTLTAGASADDSEQQATDLTTSWTAAAGTAITWAYSTATHKFTVSKASGTLNLLCKTGSPLSQGMWERLGFKTDTDRTGALSYTADFAVYDNPEASHFLVAMIEAVRDDAAGTYTGTANGLIIRPAEMFYFLLVAYLRQTVDVASIVAARTTSNISIQECRIHLGTPRKLRDIFAALAASGISDIIVDGSGTWYWKNWGPASLLPQTAFVDRDFITFRSGRRPQDVYNGVELAYGQRPLVDALPHKFYTVDPSIQTKHGRTEVLNIETARTLDNSALDDLGNFMASLAAQGPRVFEFSSRGKLADRLPGDKINLTRARGLDPAGKLGSAFPLACRILSLRYSLSTGITTCLCVEDIPFAH